MTTLLCWQGQRWRQVAGCLLLLLQLLSDLLDVFEQLRCVLIVLIPRTPFRGAQLCTGHNQNLAYRVVAKWPSVHIQAR